MENDISSTLSQPRMSVHTSIIPSIPNKKTSVFTRFLMRVAHSLDTFLFGFLKKASEEKNKQRHDVVRGPAVASYKYSFSNKLEAGRQRSTKKPAFVTASKLNNIHILIAGHQT